MDGPLPASLSLRLTHLQNEIGRRDSLVRTIYGFLFVSAGALFILFPFPMSRIGSVVLVVGFGYMIWRCATARTVRGNAPSLPLTRELVQLDSQIELGKSMLFNVPFLVGANLFWMGLPGPGTAFVKATLDLIFLAATVVIFCWRYLLNQQFIRRELIPLRDELARLACKADC